MWYLEVWREIEWGHGSWLACRLSLGTGAAGAIYAGRRGQGHRVSLTDQVRQVGECLRCRAVQQGPVVAEGARGGGGH